MEKLPLKSLFIVALSLASISSGAQSFGPWPHQYFEAGQRLSCFNEADPCNVARMDDIQALKTDWLNSEQGRLQRIERISELARLQAEKVLVVANTELSENDESAFGALYMEYGSKLLDNIGEKKIDRAKLLVSQSSPMFHKILELEGKLNSWQNQIDEQEDADLKEGLILLKKEKYKEWASNKEFAELLGTMEVFQKEFFPKQEDQNFEQNLIDGMMNLRVELSEHISFIDCPSKAKKQLSENLGGIQFSKIHRKSSDWDPIRDQNFLRFVMIGKGQGEPLTVKCAKAKVLGRVKASLEKGHTLLVKFRTKKEDDGSDSYKLPSRSDLIKALK